MDFPLPTFDYRRGYLYHLSSHWENSKNLVKLSTNSPEQVWVEVSTCWCRWSRYFIILDVAFSKNRLSRGHTSAEKSSFALFSKPSAWYKCTMFVERMFEQALLPPRLVISIGFSLKGFLLACRGIAHVGCMVENRFVVPQLVIQWYQLGNRQISHEASLPHNLSYPMCGSWIPTMLGE